MSLTPFNVFVGVVAAWVSRFFGFVALGVHDGRCRLGILARPLPLVCTQDFEDEGSNPAQSESSEMVANGRLRREVVGQKPPMTAALEHIEDGVENIA